MNLSNLSGRRLQIIPLVLTVLMVTPGGWCADETASFQELQGKYQTFLKETAKPLSDVYQRKLAELEKAAVLKRNYVLAEKIKSARETAAKELGFSLSDAGPAAPESPVSAILENDGSITMNAPSATTAGGVRMDAEKNALVGWDNEKASARWKLPAGIKTGGYEVELTYACANGGGSFVVKDDTYSLKRQSNDSGSWMSFRPEVCGVLRVKSTSQQLHVSAASIVGEGLFYLRQVRLLPCDSL